MPGPVSWTVPDTLVPKGFEELTTLSTPARALTVPVGAKLALLQAEDQDIRFRDDGTDPTASIGMLLKVGANPFPYVGDLAALRFFEAAASAQLNVLYYAYSGQ